MVEATDQKPARPVTVALVKMVPEKGQLKANWRRLERVLERLEQRGDRLDCVVTPECLLDGYYAAAPEWDATTFEEIAQVAERSEYVRMAESWARRLNSYLVFCFTERLADGCYNAARLVDRTGAHVGTYYKTHLQDHDLRFRPGPGLPCFDTDFGRVGLAICADRRWPEVIRCLRLQGAEVVLIPSYGWHHLDNEWWMRTRAYENEAFVLFAHPNVAFVASPTGDLEAKLESALDDSLVHRFDLRACTTTMLASRRPELYGAICNP